MAESTARLRQLWKRYECNEEAMEVIPFGPDRIRVAPETAPAWEALAAVLMHHGYDIRTADTDSYNCRNIKGTNQKSLHSFGIALDINWTTNPWIDHSGSRKVRFSSKPTQAERAEDVRMGRADTDFTEVLIRDATAIKTKGGKTVFEWGGNWKTVKDCMHFEIDVGPQDLADGIETGSVVGWEDSVLRARHAAETRVATMAALARLPDLPPLPPLPDLPRLPRLRRLPPLPRLPRLPRLAAMHALEPLDPLDPLDPLPPLDPLDPLDPLPGLPPLSASMLSGAAVAPAHVSPDRFVVIARDGLRLRAGPDTSFPVRGTVPLGTVLTVLAREGSWAQVDLEGDGAADGFVHSSFLSPASDGPNVVGEPRAPTARPDILDLVTADRIKSMFPAATSLTNISNNLPFVVAGLKSRALGDKAMVLMALATIRAETEGFLPISEGVSRFNTANTPFDLYDAGTRIGRQLGNTRPGDGPMFKGRGYVQLTGRANYSRIGSQIGEPLSTQPELANDPATAGIILAQFLKNKENAIRAALTAGNLRAARRLVNGGSHGLDRFADTYNRGLTVLPD